jgi:hypothetical protein
VNFALEALLIVVAGALSFGSSKLLRSLFSRSANDLIVGMGKSAHPIVASNNIDPAGIEQRLKAYDAIAPQLAIIEAWRVLEQLARSATSSAGTSQEALSLPADQLLASTHVLRGDALDRMTALRAARNSVAHGGIEYSNLPLPLIISDLKELATKITEG